MRRLFLGFLSLLGLAAQAHAEQPKKGGANVSIEDSGVNNTRRIRQEDGAGRIAVKQAGSGQSVDLQQSGGTDNWMDIQQSGENNRATVSQSGSGNSVTIRQSN